ncbi:DUF5696 domain-containing protein [Paenibacillus sp. GD4]|uniref:DUF5696 domain-containing protein n=1 Tax=Paenibacillus sp. GD4 TaxID=3068890 RepID=UPI00279640DA|nr:DUF5696 domain-containing protein [Paenibacillus sp. GD4]MDQ1913400.1 DUF5696 domain-containing protein [Paenibacillus sp. GD4]
MTRNYRKFKMLSAAALAAVTAAGLLVSQSPPQLGMAAAPAPAAPAPAQPADSKPAAQTTPAPAQAPAQAPAAQANRAAELPDESKFRMVAENAQLRLWVDSATGHFKTEDKRSGKVLRSYPNPEHWSKETISGTWRNNLRSPIMLEYIDMANFKSQPKIISWVEDKGVLEGFQTTSDGFKLTYHFAGTGFKIPVEVKLADDYVETKIVDSAIVEGKLSLLNLKLYPLLGAEPSLDQEGYMLVPDGPGALIRFKPNRTQDKSIYRESIYGSDYAFFNEETARQYVVAPIFGLKSGDTAFVAVMTSGEEYAKLFASPSGAFGISNWITPEWQYRVKFFQNTSQKGNAGFFTYSKERFSVPRTVRYYLLDPAQSDYTGMASKYRQYLMKDKGLKPLQTVSKKIPMFVDIVGADRKQGLIWDKYLKGTTTSEATEMINRLYGLGIENMTINYSGWQEGGYSKYGDLTEVDSRLGGNKGMKQFIQFAHSLKLPVFLTANYSQNNTETNGFRPRYDGMRNLAGRLIEFTNFNNRDLITMMSPRYATQMISKDLQLFKELGADGLHLEDGIGRYLNSDFNDRHRAPRSEVRKLHEQAMKEIKETLGGVSVERGNMYGIGELKHIHRIQQDHSHDLFVDEAVPFLQIALHGLVSYTSDWSNLRDQYQEEFLRSIEYGAYPGFIFTHADSGEMKGAYSIWYYSLNYRDWEVKALEEYQRFNEALGDVQNKLITGHRTLAPNVKQTEYENGKKIIVNYNAEPYTNGSIKVPAQDFIVITGGKTP